MTLTHKRETKVGYGLDSSRKGVDIDENLLSYEAPKHTFLVPDGDQLWPVDERCRSLSARSQFESLGDDRAGSGTHPDSSTTHPVCFSMTCQPQITTGHWRRRIFDVLFAMLEPTGTTSIASPARVAKVSDEDVNATNLTGVLPAQLSFDATRSEKR